MKIERHLSQPVGVGRLMYVGDSDDGVPCYNKAALRMCEVGTAAALAGIVFGNKSMRDVGAVVAIAGFLTL